MRHTGFFDQVWTFDNAAEQGVQHELQKTVISFVEMLCHHEVPSRR